MSTAPRDPGTSTRRFRSFSAGFWVASIVAIMVFQAIVSREVAPRPVSYSELLALVRADKLREVDLRTADVTATLKSDDPKKLERVRASRLPGLDESLLLRELDQRHVAFAGHVEQASWWQSLLMGWLLPMVALGAIYWWMMRRMGRGTGPLTFGKSRAKIYDAGAGERVTFADVAGVDEAVGEVVEIVDFLKQPDRYRALGAHVPKGVLLIGPPGTGKTLLARAIAGESGVPFFSLTGSDFVEMFVGVGAARVRDLFEQARQRAPCIVFVDEIDAIGKSRGGLTAMATHDEREQTLNQLLAEMDGFDATSGVVLLAATNRPEILDPALLRAGRFDRQVLVDRPDVRGREAILGVHTRKLKLGAVDLALVARRTPGMVGADLANVVNEAALAAARRKSLTVEQCDYEEAVDRLQLGLRKHGRVMTDAEKRRVAFHESGHALTALSVMHADPVYRVTIVGRSIGALGATLQLPSEERHLATRDELTDQLCVLLGGRAAEELIFEDVSTGAENDLERATETARQMVCRFGMSSLGAQTMGRGAAARFLDGATFGLERNFSEETARAIDSEIHALIERARQRARDLLESRRADLERVAERLMVEETLDRSTLEALVAPRAADQNPFQGERPCA